MTDRMKQSGWKRVVEGLKYQICERNFKKKRDISVVDDYICYV